MEAGRGYWKLEGAKLEFIDDVQPGIEKADRDCMVASRGWMGLMEARWGLYVS